MRKRNSIIKAVRHTGGFLLALVIGLAPLSLSLPVTVKAQTNPIDLVLGGEGAIPFYIAGIKPSDSGSMTAELRNAGTKEGFVTIWVSDIVSSEGLNPESETGDKSEPGELDKYMLFNLTSNSLVSNLHLPASIKDLPRSATDYNYIDTMPIKAGQTIDLKWHWELPADTGNIVQGDSISFTINYMLMECIVTNVSPVVTPDGTFINNVTAESENSKGKLAIAAGTTGKTAENQSLSDIWVIEINKDPLPPESDKTHVSNNFEAGPEGTTFDRPVTITLSYNPANVPQGTSENDLFIALWDKTSGQWVPLANCIVNTAAKTISARITHFSRYSAQSPVPPSLPPAEEEPEEPAGGETSTTSAQLDIDIMDNASTIETENNGTVQKTVTLNDLDDSFVIDVNAGSRITGPDGATLSRIDLKPVEIPITLPDNIVLLSPIYQLTGYTSAMEAVPVFFLPPGRLTISYDPNKLPENAFLPFIATYIEGQGLVRLNLPANYIIESGKAQALISGETLFFIAVELAPAPPPLPPKFVASDLIINPEQTFIGETVTISITIANQGETEGSYELHLIIDRIVRAIEKITLSPQSSQTLTFEVSNLSAGSHQVKIADLTGEFSVVRMEATVVESKFNWLLLDTIVAAAIAIGVIALIFVIRRSRRTQSLIKDIKEIEELTFKDK